MRTPSNPPENILAQLKSLGDSLNNPPIVHCQAVPKVKAPRTKPKKERRPLLSCYRCGHDWLQKRDGIPPYKCPKCRSPRWNLQVIIDDRRSIKSLRPKITLTKVEKALALAEIAQAGVSENREKIKEMEKAYSQFTEIVAKAIGNMVASVIQKIIVVPPELETKPDIRLNIDSLVKEMLGVDMREYIKLKRKKEYKANPLLETIEKITQDKV